jgi:competence protein ComEC
MKSVFAYRLRRSVLVIGCCLALFGGLIVARWQALDTSWWLWLILPAAVLSLRFHSAVTLVLLMGLFFSLGWFRGTSYVEKVAVHQSFHFETVTVMGRATDDAVYGRRSQLEFTIADVRLRAPEATPLIGNLTIRGFGASAVYRGDTVQATGKLYPTRGNNLGSISFAELTVVQRGTFWLNSFRRQFAAGMQSALPEPAASFGLGLLIGQRSTLPEQTEENLKHVGLTHIIAVSGYNLTIIVLACRRLLARRSKFQATTACLALISLFLLITGSSPPIVRASIISVLAIAAWYFGRTIKPLVLLLLAAGITAWANPLYLWGNVSWYLSFLAFFGVLVLAPLITKRFFGQKEPKVLVGILIESVCATILVLPYILYIFGEMSLVSLPANLLVIPFIPLAMLLALVAGLAGVWLAPIAGWLAWPATWLLTYMLDIANLFSRIPHAFIENVSFPAVFMVASYGLIAFVCWLLWCKTRTKYGMITDTKEPETKEI